MKRVCLTIMAFLGLILFTSHLNAQGEKKTLTYEKVSEGVITGKVKHPLIMRGSPFVVYIEDVSGVNFTPPKDSYVIDVMGKDFVPRILTVQVGSTVECIHNDKMSHSCFLVDDKGYDLGKDSHGEKHVYTFTQPGVYPILCRHHREMVAHIVVVKTPYFAMTDKEGKFTINGIPPGSYKLKVWGEHLKEKDFNKSFDTNVSQGNGAHIEIIL